VQQSVARPRFTTALLTIFAIIGLVLGATGIYGVLACTVARRTQAIGIRRALAAPPGRLVKQIVTHGMWPVAVGLTVGLVASYCATQSWSHQLYVFRLRIHTGMSLWRWELLSSRWRR